MSIKYKLISILLPGLLALMVFNTIDIVGKYNTVKDMGKLQEMTQVALGINAAVHESQKERGISSLFLSSGGTKFGSELQAQRVVADGKFKALKDELPALHEPELEAQVKALQTQLSMLDSARRGISDLSMSIPDSVKFYSTLNSQMIGMIGGMTHIINDAEIENHFTGFYMAQMIKEPMGIERAILNSVFTSKKMPIDIYRKLVTNISQQDSYKSAYLSVMPEDDSQALLDFYKDPIVQKTVDYREAALSVSNDGGFNVEPQEWFAAMSAKINLLNDKVINGHLKTEMLKITDERMAHAKSALIITFAISLAILIFNLMVAFTITTAITKSLGDTTSVVVEIAKGDFTQEVPVSSSDEIGVLGNSVNDMIS